MDLLWQDSPSLKRAFGDAHVCLHWIRRLLQHLRHQIWSQLGSEENMSQSQEGRIQAQTWKSKTELVCKVKYRKKPYSPILYYSDCISRHRDSDINSWLLCKTILDSCKSASPLPTKEPSPHEWMYMRGQIKWSELSSHDFTGSIVAGSETILPWPAPWLVICISHLHFCYTRSNEAHVWNIPEKTSVWPGTLQENHCSDWEHPVSSFDKSSWNAFEGQSMCNHRCRVYEGHRVWLSLWSFRCIIDCRGIWTDELPPYYMPMKVCNKTLACNLNKRVVNRRKTSLLTGFFAREPT